MIKRCIQKNPKRDAVLLNEGAEGEGKTSYSVALAYYIAEQSNREFSHKNVFFDIDTMIKFLQNNEGQIAIWDEPALQSLSGDSLSKVVKDLKRMLMMCRNKRHFIIINMTYFTEFGNYIVWQRPLGMIHVYSRNELESGRFIYVRKKFLERLWLDWKTKKQRNYKKFASRKCRGTFPDVLNPAYKYNVLSEFDFKSYEKNKNDAIQSIGNEVKRLSERDIKRKVYFDIVNQNRLKDLGVTQKVLAELFCVSERTICSIYKTCKEMKTEKSQVNIIVGNDTKNNNVDGLFNEEEDSYVVSNDLNDKFVVPNE
jgi:hypothetical protein